MDKRSQYYQQVQLLVELLGFIDNEKSFALKGGTAINLFIRDLPRLSVDIDLVYLPTTSRDEALKAITQSLNRIATNIEHQWQNLSIFKAYENKDDALRLEIKRGNVAVKVELSPVLRGFVFEPERRSVRPVVEDEFGYAEITVVSIADLYAGKICAALDRQHPRDWFDIKFLLDNEGITQEIRQAFIVYLISHNRPIHELLKPNFQELEDLFKSEFQNMAFVDISLNDLENTRIDLVEIISSSLTDSEKQFLLSFQNKKPDWKLLNLDEINKLPAVKWKLLNLNNMSIKKHQQHTKILDKLLNL